MPRRRRHPRLLLGCFFALTFLLYGSGLVNTTRFHRTPLSLPPCWFHHFLLQRLFKFCAFKNSFRDRGSYWQLRTKVLISARHIPIFPEWIFCMITYAIEGRDHHKNS